MESLRKAIIKSVFDHKNRKYYDKVLWYNRKFKAFLKNEIDFEKLENKLKLNIHIEGYKSPNKYYRDAYLKLSDGEYIVQKMKKSNELLKTLPNLHKHTKETMILYKKIDDKIISYNGKTFTKNLNFKTITTDKKHFYIRIHASEKLKDVYEKTIEEYDNIKDISNGFIDMYKLWGRYSNASKYAFHCLNNCRTPEKITEQEAEWIENAMLGGLMYSEKGKYKKAVSLDINSMYPYLMTLQFGIPMTQGEFKKLDKLSDVFQYGIYRCKIEDPNKENIYKCFRFNKNYYTHFDLTNAKELGLKISLIQDGKANFLHYPKRLSMKLMFKEYVDYFYNLKKQFKPFKKILNCLWGALYQKNTKTYHINKNEKINIESDEFSIVPSLYDGHIVETSNKSRFKTSYARMAPFLTSYGRLYMKRLMIPYINKIKRIHTDGFIITGDIPKNITLSDELGGLKLENKGKCEISDKMNVKPKWS